MAHNSAVSSVLDQASTLTRYYLGQCYVLSSLDRKSQTKVLITELIFLFFTHH